MGKKDSPNIACVLFVYLLGVIGLLVFYGPRPQRVESRTIVIQDSPEVARFRSELTYNMHLVTESGCFRRSEACLQYAEEIVTHTEDGLTVEKYRRYLNEALDDLWGRKCFRKVGTCKQEISDLFK